MKWVTWVEQHLLAPLLIFFLGGVVFVFRKLFTNEKAIALLQQEAKETRRSLDRIATIQEGIAPVVTKQTNLIEQQTLLLTKLAGNSREDHDRIVKLEDINIDKLAERIAEEVKDL